MSIKIGLMGFGVIGRKLYSESLKGETFDIKAICDIGEPKILTHLCQKEFSNTKDLVFEDNYFSCSNNKARYFRANNPGDVAWDLFDIDFVVDCTRKFRLQKHINKHLQSGAKKVIISSLPKDEIDRLVVYGVNDDSINENDKSISAGSSTMNALSILLDSLVHLGIESINMTTIHSYTSDQSLQDVAGTDFRCSRSASENIIPNNSEVEKWITDLFPDLTGKVNCNALNVPVQKGSMLDLSISFSKDDIEINDINDIIAEVSEKKSTIIGVTNDPIVSSDIIGDPRSIVFDASATMKAGKNLIKVLGWYDNGHCHAIRILDIIKKYNQLEGLNR